MGDVTLLIKTHSRSWGMLERGTNSCLSTRSKQGAKVSSPTAKLAAHQALGNSKRDRSSTRESAALSIVTCSKRHVHSNFLHAKSNCSTAKDFVKNTISPRVYLIGRNQENADRIITKCATLNNEAKVEFLKANVTELGEVDRICDILSKKDKSMNCLSTVKET